MAVLYAIYEATLTVSLIAVFESKARKEVVNSKPRCWWLGFCVIHTGATKRCWFCFLERDFVKTDAGYY